jgi:hypothetical protein
MSKRKEFDEIEFTEMMDDIFDTEQERAEYELYTKELLHKQNLLLLESLKDIVRLTDDFKVQTFISQTIKDYHEIK